MFDVLDEDGSGGLDVDELHSAMVSGRKFVPAATKQLSDQTADSSF